MAVSTIFTPGRYSQVYGNIVYQVTSDKMNLFKFRFVFDVFMNSERIARLKVTPQNDEWGQVDIARILQSYMDSEPINQGENYPAPISKAEWGWLDKDVLIYNVFIGEEYSTTEDGDPLLYNGLGSAGDPQYDPTGDRWVFNGVKKWWDKNTDLSPFYLDNNPPSETNAETHRFLTDIPRVQYVNENDWGTLSALNFHTYPDSIVSDPIYGALYEFFDENSVLITSGVSYNVIYNGGWRYDCSGNTDTQIVYPDYYKKFISYVGAYPKNADYNVGIPPNTKYYRVSLVKSLDTEPDPTPTNTPTQTNTPTPSSTDGTIQPTPTETPTNTPTPTPTIDNSCSPCVRYNISNLDRNNSVSFNYTNCDDSTTLGITILADTSISICSCTYPSYQTGTTNYDINSPGNCR